MSAAPLNNSSVETPMERIFEKVMLRKMTPAEKEILELNRPAKPEKTLPKAKSSVSRKRDPHLVTDDESN
jgi:hypothetical protein